MQDESKSSFPAYSLNSKEKKKKKSINNTSISAKPSKEIINSDISEAQIKEKNCKKKNKRKHSPVTAEYEVLSSPKQQKLDNSPKISITHKSVNKNTTNTKTKNEQKQAEVKAQNRKRKRLAIKQAFETLAEGRPLSPTFVKSIISKINNSEKQTELSKTSKKKLAVYKTLLQLADGRTDSSITNQKDERQMQQGNETNHHVKEEKNVDRILDEDNTDGNRENKNEGTDSKDEGNCGNVDETDVNRKRKAKKSNNNKANKTNKTRYVLFVGNLPHGISTDEIVEHFSKAGEVRSVRIPPSDDKRKQVGFGFVEFADHAGYENALSLHHSFLKGRRINVEYSKPSNEKGNQNFNKKFKKKNLKLHGMRKQGMFPGSVKHDQKRSVRRAKSRTVIAI